MLRTASIHDRNFVTLQENEENDRMNYHGSRGLPQFTVHGSRFTVRGSRFTVHGSRFARSTFYTLLRRGNWEGQRRKAFCWREGEKSSKGSSLRQGNQPCSGANSYSGLVPLRSRKPRMQLLLSWWRGYPWRACACCMAIG